jgi:hypothetical protein
MLRRSLSPRQWSKEILLIVEEAKNAGESLDDVVPALESEFDRRRISSGNFCP